MPYEPEWRKRARKPDPHRLGELVRQARQRLGMTQHEFALRVGVQGSFISKIETGRVKQPSLHFLGPLAAALDVPVTVLYEAATGSPAPIAGADATPPDIAAFAAWLAGVPVEERGRMYTICRALHAPAAPIQTSGSRRSGSAA